MNLVEIKDFGFSYPESSRKVLEHVNLNIKEGTLNVIMGRSGCGKSTVVNLIARFWDTDSGTVSIGGTDIKAMTTEQNKLLQVQCDLLLS